MFTVLWKQRVDEVVSHPNTQKETILGGYHNIVANGVKTFWKEKFALFSSVITRHQLQTHILLKVCRMRGIVTEECIMNKLML